MNSCNFITKLLILTEIVALSTMLTGLSTIAINYLYRKNAHVLTFPEKAKRRSNYRLPIIFLGLFASQYIFFMQNSYNVCLYIENPLILLKMLGICILLLICCTDWEQQVIFDKSLILLSILGSIYIMSTAFGLFEGSCTVLSEATSPLLNHFLAALGGGISFLILAVITRGGIGGGDIKLIAALGLWLGTDSLITVAMLGMLAGGAAALILMLFGNKNRKAMFAYGPYFALAGILAILTMC